MLELYNKGINLDYSNKQESVKQSKEIGHELRRLENLRRDYYKEKRKEFKKRHREVK